MDGYRGRMGAGAAALVGLALICAGCASTSGVQAGRADIKLIRAAEKGNTAEVVRLIKQGADINAVDAEGWTPYLAASSKGQFEAMKILKAAGARTDPGF